MLTLSDCFDFSDLTDEEITAIAECEHIPLITALEEGECLVHSRRGRKKIAAMIATHADECEACGHLEHAEKLRDVRKIFVRRFDL
jgi:hypothetical protein